MADPNLVDFHNRVARIETARAGGFGHEAEGTLGRAFFIRQPRRRSWLMPVLFLTCAAFALKGVMLYKVGPTLYEARVEQLRAGEGFDRLGGILMQADPVTLWVADRVALLAVRVVLLAAPGA
ncbi:hypothetical protein RNZ50_17885 [Paracoccaceae bacterium Fryx2]|nr:hypothetical protein [Paracoccaceae bacterium Fryx2]